MDLITEGVIYIFDMLFELFSQELVKNFVNERRNKQDYSSTSSRDNACIKTLTNRRYSYSNSIVL